MSKYPKYLIILIAVALIAVGFAGCTSSVPATVTPTPTPSTNKYYVGEVIGDGTMPGSSTPLTPGMGLIIEKYDPVGDVYIVDGVFKDALSGQPWTGKWFRIDKPMQVSRNI